MSANNSLSSVQTVLSRPRSTSPPKSSLGQHVSIIPQSSIITPVVRPEVQYTGPLECACILAGDVQCLGGGGRDCPFWAEKTAPPLLEGGGITGWIKGAFTSKDTDKCSEVRYDKESKCWFFTDSKTTDDKSVEALQQCFDDDVGKTLIGGWRELDGTWKFVHGNGKYVIDNGKPQWELHSRNISNFFHGLSTNRTDDKKNAGV